MERLLQEVVKFQETARRALPAAWPTPPTETSPFKPPPRAYIPPHLRSRREDEHALTLARPPSPLLLGVDPEQALPGIAGGDVPPLATPMATATSSHIPVTFPSQPGVPPAWWGVSSEPWAVKFESPALLNNLLRGLCHFDIKGKIYSKKSCQNRRYYVCSSSVHICRNYLKDNCLETSSVHINSHGKLVIHMPYYCNAALRGEECQLPHCRYAHFGHNIAAARKFQR